MVKQVDYINVNFFGGGGGGIDGQVGVIDQAELLTALGDVDVRHIFITESFTINQTIDLVSDKKITSIPGRVITATGTFSSDAVFRIPASVRGAHLESIRIDLTDNVDVLLIENLANKNIVQNCEFNLQATSVTKSGINIDGQNNSIVGNIIDLGGSIVSPGAVFLDSNASNNAISGNVFL